MLRERQVMDADAGWVIRDTAISQEVDSVSTLGDPLMPLVEIPFSAFQVSINAARAEVSLKRQIEGLLPPANTWFGGCSRAGASSPTMCRCWPPTVMIASCPCNFPPWIDSPDAHPEAGITLTMLGCQRVRLDGSPSRDPEGGALQYRWVFADGSERQGLRVERHYGGAGEDRVRLEVSDNTGRIGNSAAAETLVVIRPPPTVRIQAPAWAAPGEPLALVGLADTVEGAEIVQYHWDLGDGAVASGSAVEHVYQQPGRYPLRLRVRDDSGHPCNSAAAEATVAVNAAPRPSFDAPDRVAVDQTLTLDASASHHPGRAAHRLPLGFR